ncbi:MAG: 23S rRNA (pseudouridine(1915)-N(3))-methyltransferase RlmH [Bdellovibrionales bacterium]|nr:23S rRNA (pseudouridine(1915)-N(3))-methyltransferase RlmH [Bdellovibrionales bacterium]
MVVGRPKLPFVDEAVEHYASAIRRSAELEIEVLKDAESDPAREAESVRRLLARRKWQGHTELVLLDEKGAAFTSRDFAGWMAARETAGVSRLVFVVGGAFGLHESLRLEGDHLVSLSKMTFPHDFARAVILEQIYRALQIRQGGKYHHD